MPALRIEQVVAGEGFAELLEDRHQLTPRDVLAHLVLVHDREPESRSRQADVDRRVGRQHSRLYRDDDLAPILGELPAVGWSTGARMPVQAVVLHEVARVSRNWMPSEVARRADDRHPYVARDRDCNHVLVDHLAKLDPGV